MTDQRGEIRNYLSRGVGMPLSRSPRREGTLKVRGRSLNKANPLLTSHFSRKRRGLSPIADRTRGESIAKSPGYPGYKIPNSPGFLHQAASQVRSKPRRVPQSLNAQFLDRPSVLMPHNRARLIHNFIP